MVRAVRIAAACMLLVAVILHLLGALGYSIGGLFQGDFGGFEWSSDPGSGDVQATWRAREMTDSEALWELAATWSGAYGLALTVLAGCQVRCVVMLLRRREATPLGLLFILSTVGLALTMDVLVGRQIGFVVPVFIAMCSSFVPAPAAILTMAWPRA